MQSCCPSRSTRGSAVETPPVTCRWRAISGQRRVFASFLDGGWRNGKRGAWSLARDRGRQRSRRVTCAQGGGGSEVAGAVHYVPHRAQKSTPNGISGPPPPQGKRWEGYPELFGVSLLYGSYSPVIKLIFAEDRALDPSTLTAIRTVLSALVLMAAVAWQLLFVEGNKGVQVHESQATGQVAKPTPSPDSEGLDFGILRKDPTREGPLAFYWTGVLPAGIELGLYNFAGTAAQAMGLQLTSATRAAFLVQLTGLLVPMLSYLAGEKISAQVWKAVAMGLLGSCMVAFDGIAHVEGDFMSGGANELRGALLIAASCTSYSLATVRLGVYAPRMNTINLTAVKKITLGVTSIAWFISALPMAHQGGSAFTCSDELYDLGITGRPLSSYALIAYSGLGCGAAATFLQTRGQARVPPPSAQVIYSLTPLWSALIAQVALGDETLGPAAWGGGGAMLLASLLAARAQAEAQQNL